MAGRFDASGTPDIYTGGLKWGTLSGYCLRLSPRLRFAFLAVETRPRWTARKIRLRLTTSAAAAVNSEADFLRFPCLTEGSSALVVRAYFWYLLGHQFHFEALTGQNGDPWVVLQNQIKNLQKTVKAPSMWNMAQMSFWNSHCPIASYKTSSICFFGNCNHSGRNNNSFSRLVFSIFATAIMKSYKTRYIKHSKDCGGEIGAFSLCLHAWQFSNWNMR